MNSVDPWTTFLAWEQASRDTIDFKTIYVDMADDLISGLLLSQIVYWYLPSKKGQSKLRVFKDGYYWIAKARHEWWDEIRVKTRQIDRAITILEKKGIIVSRLYRFNNAPTTHIRIVKEGFLAAWNNALARFDEMVKSEILSDPFSPNLQFDLTDSSSGFDETVKSDLPESVQSLTETTIDLPETTAENTNDFPMKDPHNPLWGSGGTPTTHCDTLPQPIVYEEKEKEIGERKEKITPVSEKADPLLFSLDRKTTNNKESNYAVPPSAGGFDPFADGPLSAFARFIAGVVPGQLPARTRKSWAAKLRQIAEQWSTEDRPITAEIMEQAIRAVPESDIGWKTYTSPFAGNFETDIGPLLLGGGQMKQKGKSHAHQRIAPHAVPRETYTAEEAAPFIQSIYGDMSDL